MTEIVERQAVVTEAASWLGTPYHHMGRVKGAGVDCAMLPAEVYAAVGLIPYLDIAYYPADWHLHRSGERYLAYVLQFADEITEEQVGPGDLVLWRYGRAFAHGAIVTDWDNCIHAAVHGRVQRVTVSQDEALSARPHRFFSFWEAAA